MLILKDGRFNKTPRSVRAWIPGTSCVYRYLVEWDQCAGMVSHSSGQQGSMVTLQGRRRNFEAGRNGPEGLHPGWSKP